MQILSIVVEGLRDLPKCIVEELQHSTEFRGPNPLCSALADSLSLWFAALSKEELSDLLLHWGWSTTEDIDIVGEDYPEQVLWSDGLLPSLWVDGSRRFSVTVTIALNAEQIGQIRAATQDPSTLIALMERPEFKMTISALFTNDFCGMAISKSDIFIGDYEVPLERPYWLQRVLYTFRGRFYRNYENFSIAEQALRCALSVDRYPAYVAFQKACQEYGHLRVAYGSNNEPVLLLDDRPIHRWGWSMARKLRSVGSLYLFSADIVWIDDWQGDKPDDVQVFSTSSTGRVILEKNQTQRSLTFPRE